MEQQDSKKFDRLSPRNADWLPWEGYNAIPGVCFLKLLIANIIKMINKETIKKKYVEELKAIIDNRYNKIKHDFLMNDINLNDYKGDLIEIFAKK